MKTYAWRDMNFMRWVEGNLKNNLFVFLNRKEEGQDHTVRYPKSEDQNTTLPSCMYVCMWSCSVMSDSLQPMDCSLPHSWVHGILFFHFILCFYKTIWASKAMFLWATGAFMQTAYLSAKQTYSLSVTYRCMGHLKSALVITVRYKHSHVFGWFNSLI